MFRLLIKIVRHAGKEAGINGIDINNTPMTEIILKLFISWIAANNDGRASYSFLELFVETIMLSCSLVVFCESRPIGVNFDLNDFGHN